MPTFFTATPAASSVARACRVRTDDSGAKWTAVVRMAYRGGVRTTVSIEVDIRSPLLAVRKAIRTVPTKVAGATTVKPCTSGTAPPSLPSPW